MKRLVGSVVGISLLTALSAFAQEKPASGPGTSGGGVSLCTITEGNKLVEKDNCEQLLDSYMRKSRVNVQELEAYKKYVGPRLSELEKILPDFAAELREAFEEKDWFMSNLKQKIPDLGKEGNGTDLPVKQRAVQYQDSDEIWADKDWYDRQPTDEQADFLWHEALVHIRLKSLEAKKPGVFGSMPSQINSDELQFRHYINASPSMDDVRRMVVVLGGNTLPTTERLQRKVADHTFGLYLTATDKQKVNSLEKTYLKKMQQACREDNKNGYITNRMYAMGQVLHELYKETAIDRSVVIRGNLSAKTNALDFAYAHFKRRLQIGDELDILGADLDSKRLDNCPESAIVVKGSTKYCRVWVSRSSLSLVYLNDSTGRVYLNNYPDKDTAYESFVHIGGMPTLDKICTYADKKLNGTLSAEKQNDYQSSIQVGGEEKISPAK